MVFCEGKHGGKYFPPEVAAPCLLPPALAPARQLGAMSPLKPRSCALQDLIKRWTGSLTLKLRLLALAALALNLFGGKIEGNNFIKLSRPNVGNVFDLLHGGLKR